MRFLKWAGRTARNYVVFSATKGSRMPHEMHPQLVIRFGPFEADFQTQELRKQGIRLGLPGQSFQILKMLLERPGRLVTREELQSALWPSDTFVDFERGINAAINRLRATLDDSADQPRFVETLPRRGYRFIGAIVPDPPVAENPGNSVVAIVDDDDKGWSLNWIKVVWAAVGVVCAMAAVLGYLSIGRHNDALNFVPIPVTAYPGLESNPTFSPDGSQIAFAWNGGSISPKDFDLYVKVIGSENRLRLTNHPSDFIGPAWSPDGTRIAFHRISGANTGIYAVPALGGAERKLRSTHLGRESASQISWSPDGKWIAFEDNEAPEVATRIYVLSTETLDLRQIPHAPECLEEKRPAFGHVGGKLAYSCLLNRDRDEFGLYVMQSLNAQPKSVTSAPVKLVMRGLAWSADDQRLVIVQDYRTPLGAEGGLYEVTLADGSIRQIMLGQNAFSPAISAKGGGLAYETCVIHHDIWRKDLLHPEQTAEELISSTRVQVTPAYSPDGKHIAFVSSLSGTLEIWIANTDGTQPVQLTKLENEDTDEPSWSPDGTKLAFESGASGRTDVYVVDVAERVPRKLRTNVSDPTAMPSWSHDGQWIYFSSMGNNGQRVYRSSATGGDAVLLAALPSGERGVRPLESFDGKSVYFAKYRGRTPLGTVSLSNPGATMAVEKIRVLDSRLWTVATSGIYFVPEDAPKTLTYFDFNTKNTRQVLQFDKDPHFGLSISPNGRWIAYSQVDDYNSDIMRVEHFR
jgi:Tol biopolymer transport system component/DNA-binding winged helix-turn-helix (wHTH) protein